MKTDYWKDFQMQPHFFFETDTWMWVYKGIDFYHSGQDWEPTRLNLAIEFCNKMMDEW